MTEREMYGGQIRKTPLVINGIFTQVLQQYFGKNPGTFRWDPDHAKTNLVIVPSYKWHPAPAQKRPICLIKRGGISYRRIAIDDHHSTYPIEDALNYAVLANGTVNLLCACENEGTSSRLAEEVSGLFLAYAPVLRREFDFTRFQVESIQEVGILKEHEDIFVCPVLVSYEFNEVWALIGKAPKINQIVHAIWTMAYDTHTPVYGSGAYGEGSYG